LLSLRAEDKDLIDRLIRAVRAVASRPSVSAHHIYLSAILIRALERLPLPTPSVGLSLTLSIKQEDGSGGYYCLEVDADSISLSTGEIMFGPFGHDHQCRTIVSIGMGFREGDDFGMESIDWADYFLSRASNTEYEVSFEDFGDSTIDWHDKTDSQLLWEKLPSDYVEPKPDLEY
jgi:hypothetical protein